MPGRSASVDGPKPRVPGKSSKGVERGSRGLRGLVGAGPTQVSITAALRARDASRPEPEDIAAAERNLTFVRRHYVPPATGPGDGTTSDASYDAI